MRRGHYQRRYKEEVEAAEEVVGQESEIGIKNVGNTLVVHLLNHIDPCEHHDEA